ncbi:MAG: hypothetical protein NT107_04780, partial [Planctomycetota bacterium]|nr:hypothetical protein [Planctomycetota bacterium]
YGHAMAYDSGRNRTVLFGGLNGSYLGDTWEWNGATAAWTQVASTGPQSRYEHAMAYDSSRNRTVLFGGLNGSYLGDTWELTAPPTGPTGPTADIAYTAIPTSQTPPPVTAHAAAALPCCGTLLFGGTTGSTLPMLTYELQNGSWSKQFSIINPATRANASLLLDPVRGNNLMFGGQNPVGTALNDTWTYLGGQWTYLPLATAPSPRSLHRMTYDSAQQQGILFGGKDANNAPLDDQWLWNGTGWAITNPATRPPARFAHGLAYDAFRSRTVLFGGQNATTLLDDVWEYNNLTWSQITPTPPTPPQTGTYGPSARALFGMAYDQKSERVMILGGDTATGCQDDAWSWDGVGFVRHNSTNTIPNARNGAQLFYNETSNQLNLLAGGCGTIYNNDLWSIDLPVFWRSSTFGAGCAPLSGITPTLSPVPNTSGVIGNTFAVRLANLPNVLTVTVPFFGFSNTNWGALPLPLPLATFGLPGCTLYADPIYNSFLLAFTGSIDWNIPIPNNAGLIGFNLYFQSLVVDPLSGNPFGGVTTNAVSLRIGNR